MDRRGFLGLLGKAAVGGVIAYSFPSVIVPQNCGEVVVYKDLTAASPFISELNAITLKEIYPRVIRDEFFMDTPFLAYLRRMEGPFFARMAPIYNLEA